MIKLHIVIHEEFEGLGVIKDWISKKGYEVSFSRVYLNEELPTTIDNLDGLIVMGGPQSPNTTKEECSYFDAIAEMALIKNFIDHQKIVIGVCLGAQMIGQALGAPVEKSPEPEIGYFPIMKTKEGHIHTKLVHFPDNAVVGHWHGDMAGLTPEAKVLAYSEGCPRQIIEYADLVYGLQCHMEFNASCIEGLIENSTEELAVLSARKYVDSIEVLRNKIDFDFMNTLLFTFLDHVIKEYKNKNQQAYSF
ncbi:gamma-glutamyl-gamma-aminobutyrate hydrolase family protein [Aquimarina sp. I32.4]|uniref:glutamine amidotransferase-related protein n=1 Tax=Aquimarina sp. I32.4 TaxID=2053903 RepID=UPI001E415774|nr:gamma-glutamyl-gamma-aminobutyrate hydrolase family protein [Aquimarina sp. I32.4]